MNKSNLSAWNWVYYAHVLV